MSGKEEVQMYKTREDVEAMIELVEYLKIKCGDFCMWVVNSLSIPQPGVVCSEPSDCDVES